MAERLVMDPAAAIDDRESLDITPWVSAAGLDSGDAAIEPYRAEALLGEDVIDARIPNRTMSAPLLLRDMGGTTLQQIRSKIQAKVALWQREGGALGRYTSAGTAYASVVAAGLQLGGDLLQAIGRVDTNAVLEMEALPGWEESEVELSSHEEKTATELIWTESNIKGDMPAPVRVEVTEKQGVEQRGLIWSFRSRYYSNASTAKPAYEAEELLPLDTAVKAALTGASGGTVVRHGTISTAWTPVLGGRIGGTAYPTHEGQYRVFARVYSSSGTTVSARLTWDVGDLAFATENPAWSFPGKEAFYVADLGEVRLAKSPVGAHRWDWQIQAKGVEGSEDFRVDRVWLVNSDEPSGRLSAPLSFNGLGISSFSARSEFNTESGAITGDSLAVGGVWTVVTNSDTDDFSVAASVATRSAVSDTGTGAGIAAGRAITAGTATFSNVAVSLDFKHSVPGANQRSGVILRVLNSASYFSAQFLGLGGAEQGKIFVSKCVGGVETILAVGPLVPFPASTFFTLSAAAFSGGAFIAQLSPQGASSPQSVLVGSDAMLASGGTIASGRIGFADYAQNATTNTRTYDNFRAWVPPNLDAIVFASQKAQLTTDGMYRLDSGGTAYGPVSRVIGDLPRIPPTAGGRTTEVFIKGSRGDLGEIPDSGIDDVAAKVSYKPTWLTFPGG